MKVYFIGFMQGIDVWRSRCVTQVFAPYIWSDRGALHTGFRTIHLENRYLAIAVRYTALTHPTFGVFV